MSNAIVSLKKSKLYPVEMSQQQKDVINHEMILVSSGSHCPYCDCERCYSAFVRTTVERRSVTSSLFKIGGI